MVSQSNVYQKIKNAVDYIHKKSSIRPKVGIILGSGLGSIADQITERIAIPYAEIPGFHGTSVEGHAGQMVLGYFESVPIVCLQGRFHLYEGYPMEDVVFPTRTICGLGIQTLILTNAAGGINTAFRPKDLMVISDHLNLMGDNPLKGPNLSDFGPRFPDMTEAYNKQLNRILLETGTQLGIDLKTGIYAGLLGPTYETPSEVKMYRILGGDAVGMSTVPENIAANHFGVRVCGISCITNLAAGISNQPLSHEEVIQNSKEAASNLTRLLEAAIPKMA